MNHLINLYHAKGHFSSSKVRAALLGAGYWFPKMRKLIATRTQHCNVCVGKSGGGFVAQDICLLKSPSVEAFEVLAVDLVGPLPVQRNGYRYILTMLDHSTRWLEAVPLKDISVATCAKAIERTWIQHYGPPPLLFIRTVVRNLPVPLCENW